MSGCDSSQKAQKTQTIPATSTAPGGQKDPAPQSSVGKYFRQNSPQDYTELKSDGTFLIHQSDFNGDGKYKINGKRLILTLSTGVVVEGNIELKTMIDNRGNVWEKK
jgi:hypothetical protein